MELRDFQTIIEIVSGADFNESQQIAQGVSIHIQNGWSLIAIHERGWKSESAQMTTVYILGHPSKTPNRWKFSYATNQWEYSVMTTPYKLPDIPF
jgi:spore coat polysaccharide biosynthesis protein SpsF (cytidylyltransferase family)